MVDGAAATRSEPTHLGYGATRTLGSKNGPNAVGRGFLPPSVDRPPAIIEESWRPSWARATRASATLMVTHHGRPPRIGSSRAEHVRLTVPAIPVTTLMPPAARLTLPLHAAALPSSEYRISSPVLRPCGGGSLAWRSRCHSHNLLRLHRRKVSVAGRHHLVRVDRDCPQIVLNWGGRAVVASVADRGERATRDR